MKTKRVYISGPISNSGNKEEIIARFAKVEEMLVEAGFRVFNPLKNGLPFDADTHQHMRRDLNILTNEDDPFDYIFMMRRWNHSAGCYLEFRTAVSCGIAVMFEDSRLGVENVRIPHCIHLFD